MRRMKKQPFLNNFGFTLIEVIIAGIILFILLFFLVTLLKGCGAFGSAATPVPTKVTINGPSTIPSGKSEIYTVNLTINTAPSGSANFKIYVEESDGFWDDNLASTTITIGNGQTTGTGTVELTCTNNIISGNVGPDDEQSPAQIQVEAENMPFNLRGEAIIDVTCVAEEEEEEEGTESGNDSD